MIIILWHFDVDSDVMLFGGLFDRGFFMVKLLLKKKHLEHKNLWEKYFLEIFLSKIKEHMLLRIRLELAAWPGDKENKGVHLCGKNPVRMRSAKKKMNVRENAFWWGWASHKEDFPFFCACGSMQAIRRWGPS